MKTWAVVLLLLLAGIVVFSVWYGRRDHLSVIHERAGSLQAVDTLSTSRDPDHASDRRLELLLHSSTGLSFRATQLQPDTVRATSEGIPAVLLLGGLGTGRKAARLPRIEGPVVRMAIDYPYDGPQRFKAGSFLVAVPRLRKAVYDGAAASVLATEYLASAEGVDPKKLFVVGCSFGAFFAPIAAAVCERVDGLAVIQGGGDLALLIESNLDRRFPAPIRKLVGRLGATVLHPFEPTRWVGRLSPRPVLLVNSRADSRIPRSCVDALYDAAGEPRSLVWIDSGHLRPTDEALIQKMVREVEERLIAAD